VFPTFDNYVEQFKIFIDKIEDGGVLAYNNEDENIVKLVNDSSAKIEFIPYKTPEYKIEDGSYVLVSKVGEYKLDVFGKHNLQNIEGARVLCMQMGVDEKDFYEAISDFKGASRRLEEVYADDDHVVYKDFAHSPSKVAASVSAISERFSSEKKLIVLELHTYSSLNPEFLKQYKGSLDMVHDPVVYVDKTIVENKRMKPITESQIKDAFAKGDLLFFDDADDLKDYVNGKLYDVQVVLFMSSGNIGGLDLASLY
jgi:UDP-N-acetylmuramate: L-alanyl-gamma-D-glutamyl-meso-diaminopimelate ligase